MLPADDLIPYVTLLMIKKMALRIVAAGVGIVRLLALLTFTYFWRSPGYFQFAFSLPSSSARTDAIAESCLVADRFRAPAAHHAARVTRPQAMRSCAFLPGSNSPGVGLVTRRAAVPPDAGFLETLLVAEQDDWCGARDTERLIKWFIGVVVIAVGVNLLSSFVVAQTWAWLPPAVFVAALLVVVLGNGLQR